MRLYTSILSQSPFADKPFFSTVNMAAKAPAASPAATEHSDSTSAASPAATEHSDATPLSELLNQECGQTGSYELKVIRVEIVDYSYPWQGKQIATQKVQAILQSHKPEEYCIGVAKLQKKDKEELKQVLKRFAIDTTWKFTKVKLLDDKSAYIHTTCRITIDLRKTTATAMLQSASFPRTPCPTTTIADIVKLKQMQRFDLMAIPESILAERRAGLMTIADIRLTDGSKDPRDKTDTPANATIPLTLFFTSNDQFAAFKECIGCTPLLFMCLAGNLGTDQRVNVATLKAMSWWEKAGGTKCDKMKEQAGVLCDASAARVDVAHLATFQPMLAADYTGVPATLSACSLLTSNAKHEGLLGSEDEQLYQLNNLYVVPPSKADSITTGTNNHLWTQLDCWDYSKKITIAFRSKAMLELAQLKPEESEIYKDQHTSGELRHPVLASVRVRVQKKKEATEHKAENEEQGTSQTDATEHRLSVIAVEAAPCTFTEIPNDSVEAIHGLVAAGPAATSERLAATTLRNLKPSPFYNMEADEEPADKALVLLKFTQRSVGKQILNGFRIVTDHVQDACDTSAGERYGTIACCTPEKSTDFTAAKNSHALAIVCKVMTPSKQQHTTDLYIESMEPIPGDRVDQAIAMVKQLQRVSTVNHGNAATSTEAAWQQRKCRRMQRYPTQM